jgi:archaellum component FlaF (FlaF/FlaG flagellin family)
MDKAEKKIIIDNEESRFKLLEHIEIINGFYKGIKGQVKNRDKEEGKTIYQIMSDDIAINNKWFTEDNLQNYTIPLYKYIFSKKKK